MDPLSQYLDKVKNHHTSWYGNYLGSVGNVPREHPDKVTLIFDAFIFLVGLVFVGGVIIEIFVGKGMDPQKLLLTVFILGTFALFVAVYLLVKAGGNSCS
jgi:hypothetical protein